MKSGRLTPGLLSPGVWVVIALCAVVFLANHHIVRPWVLHSVDGGPAVVIVNSLPNFIEAIIGTIDIAIALALLARASSWFRHRVKGNMQYVIATAIAGVFVVLSELNVISIRGPNVSDPNDIVASILGLLTVLAVLVRFGLLSEHE